MAEYKVKGGYTLTDEEIVRLGEACERGDYPGEPGDWIVRPKGRPSLSEEPLVSVSVKFPRSMVAAIDATGRNRSDFIRGAVASAL